MKAHIGVDVASGVVHTVKGTAANEADINQARLHQAVLHGRDFLAQPPYPSRSFDWVITNPPFRLAEAFVLQALDVARDGVAIFARSVFIESVRRYRSIFERTPPSRFAQFTERVPLVKGRLDRNATRATTYAWLILEKESGQRSAAADVDTTLPPGTGARRGL